MHSALLLSKKITKHKNNVQNVCSNIFQKSVKVKYLVRIENNR